MKENFKKLIKEYTDEQEWNHQFTFSDGTKTRKIDIDSPGYNLNKWPRIKNIIRQLSFNKGDFIDVGCSDGYYSLQLAKLNERYNVTGIDLDEIRIKKAKLVKEIFEVKNVNFFFEDLYNLIDQKKKFETVLGLGLLHRVPDINACIKDLCEISERYVIFEFKSYNSEIDEALSHNLKTKSNKLNKLYKTPSIIYVKNRMKENSFKTLLFDEDTTSSLNYPRTIIVGERIE